jgi:hypothetical protein
MSLGSISSVTTGRPVASRASERYLRPSSPNPWKAYGEVRGLKAPPRRNDAPDEATSLPIPSIISLPSTEHGPAKNATVPPPIFCPRTVMTVSSFWKSRLTILYGLRMRRTFSTHSIPSNASGCILRSSPMAPMIVRSTPREMCAMSPYALIFSSTWLTSWSVAPPFNTMIMYGFSLFCLPLSPSPFRVFQRSDRPRVGA